MVFVRIDWFDMLVNLTESIVYSLFMAISLS